MGLLSLVRGYIDYSKYKPRVLSTKPRTITPADVISSNFDLFQDRMLEWKKFTHIIIHHSYTKDSKIEDTKSIWKYHMSYRIDGNIVTKDVFFERKKKLCGTVFEEPMKTIGYHALVEEVDSGIRSIAGRPLWMAGGHTRNWNDRAIGICVIGAFDTVPPTKSMMESAALLARKFQFAFKMPLENIIGHGVANALSGLPYKSCPGKAFDMASFRKIVSQIPDSALL